MPRWAGLSSRRRSVAVRFAAEDLATPRKIPRIRPLLTLEADRAREFYRSGEELIPLSRRQPARPVGADHHLPASAGENCAPRLRCVQEKIQLPRAEKLMVLGKGFLKRSGVMTAPWTQAPNGSGCGGGLAGLASACALADSGFRVTLFERRPFLGGRASSYEHPGTGEIVDNCQHVLLGCCTNLIDFYRRIGVEDIDSLVRAADISGTGWPGVGDRTIGSARSVAHCPAFLRAACLISADKLAIAAQMALAPACPRDQGKSFLEWLQQHGQTAQAIERFWKTILVSALNEDLDRISVPYAAQVVRESFLKSAAARAHGRADGPAHGALWRGRGLCSGARREDALSGWSAIV